MSKLKKINVVENKVAMYGEGRINHGGHEPTEIKMVMRNDGFMWHAEVGVWTGTVYNYLYR